MFKLLVFLIPVSRFVGRNIRNAGNIDHILLENFQKNNDYDYYF